MPDPNSKSLTVTDQPAVALVFAQRVTQLAAAMTETQHENAVDVQLTFQSVTSDERLKASVACHLTIRHTVSGIKQEDTEAAEIKFSSALSVTSCSMVLAMGRPGAVEGPV